MKNIVLILMCGGLFYAVYFAVMQNAKNDENTRLIQEQSAKIAGLSQNLRVSENTNQTLLAKQTATVEKLRADLKNEEEALEAASQRYQIANNVGIGGTIPSTWNDELQAERAAVKVLEQNLSNLDAQRPTPTLGSNNFNEQAKLDYQANMQSIDAQILSYNQSSATIKNQLAGMKKVAGLGNLQYQNQGLNTQLTDNKNNVQQLIEQKHALQQQWKSQNDTVKDQNVTQRNDFVKNREQMRLALEDERVKLRDLEKQHQDAASSQKAQKDQLKKLEADYSIQKAKVQDLKAQLKIEEQK